MHLEIDTPNPKLLWMAEELAEKAHLTPGKRLHQVRGASRYLGIGLLL
jgi:hypothetical protein